MKKFFLPIVVILLIFSGCQTSSQKPKYVFLFIGDGMGMSHVQLAKLYSDSVLKKDNSISFLNFPVASNSTTYAANRFITGSAASGTALSTGYKTSINTLGLSSDHSDTLYSIAKRFKEHGRKVALITSVSIDHATPAAFYAHVPYRGMYYQIATQLFKSDYDFFASGGFRDPYNYKQDSSSISIFELGDKKGYNFTTTFEGVDSLVSNGAKHIIYSVSNPAPGSTLKYDIDRDSTDVTLADLTRKAIEVVDNPNGFFMMVEGGKIDWAAHDNDAATVIYEVLAFSDAVNVAVDFYKKHPDETIIIVTADHETGGLSIGNRENHYDNHVALLQYQKVSKEKLHEIINDYLNKNNKPRFDELLNIISNKTGLNKEIALSSAEIAILKESFNKMVQAKNFSQKTLYSETDLLTSNVLKLLNSKAGIGWTSGSHTAEPVPVFVIGEGHESFMNQLDNTDIPKRIAEISGI
ncbi:MAG: alkaline phosphatase [Tenuifilum sp.]|jgi:alkaline phosphatase|uniref:alkaline phosphatase n=1 Tax=Tenuifilum sp. TaxID=2760880 RepID=UPI0024ABB57F|nr:alkaline phosphatase [Tenuifilum sp.]MDI3525981.1 alkaline phosphatase [Tenuifilum sp.]